MKTKQIVTAFIVLLCGGLAIYALLRSDRHAAKNSDEEEETPSTEVTVQTGTLRDLTLHRYVTGYGTVMPAPATPHAPAADAPLAAPTAGVVASVEVVEGQPVHRGQLLLTLNSSTITFAYAEQEVARQKKLYAEHNTALKSLQDAETQLALLRVTSPLAGTVTRVNVKPGAAVDLTTVVVEVMDLNRLVVSSAIPEANAAELTPGETVEVETQPRVKASLTYISPEIDAASGTIMVRTELPPGSALHPGQFVPLRIVTGVHEHALAAPEAGIVTNDSGQSVLALVQGDRAIQTPVKTGFQENGWVEVSGPGLKAGDTVVTVGAYGLPDKTQIQVVNPPSGATPEANPSAPAGP